MKGDNMKKTCIALLALLVATGAVAQKCNDPRPLEVDYPDLTLGLFPCGAYYGVEPNEVRVRTSETSFTAPAYPAGKPGDVWVDIGKHYLLPEGTTTIEYRAGHRDAAGVLREAPAWDAVTVRYDPPPTPTPAPTATPTPVPVSQYTVGIVRKTVE